MANPPNKAKPAAPAQFDMNSRDRKGGKGGPHGSSRGRDEKRPPSQIVNLPPSVVDRGEGWIIRKIGKIDQASRTSAGAVYELVFDGHDPLTFNYLSAARDRSKEAPPEKAEPETETETEAVAAEEPEAAVETETPTDPS